MNIKISLIELQQFIRAGIQELHLMLTSHFVTYTRTEPRGVSDLLQCCPSIQFVGKVLIVRKFAPRSVASSYEPANVVSDTETALFT